jgi:ABC-type spermidine/putrescine transport system permease subunit I
MTTGTVWPVPHEVKALRRVERRNRLAPIPYLAPVSLFLLGMYIYPIAHMLRLSLFDPSFTLRHYQHLLATPVYLQIMLLTFRVAVMVTFVSLALGYPVAYLLTTAPAQRRGFFLALVLVPLWTSVLVRNYAWMVLLSKNGIINQLLLMMGVVSKPLSFLFNTTGVVIGLTYILIPFMILALHSVMAGIDRQLLRAGATLGASPFQCFLRIFLPLSIPGIAAGCLLVFIMGIGSFITPALLGGGRVPMIATLIESQVAGVLNWGLGSAISMVLLVATIALFAIYIWIVRIENLLGAGRGI